MSLRGGSRAGETKSQGVFSGPRKGWGYLVVVAACFTMAALSFVGSSALSNRRLERVAGLTHDVSENAMPSLAHLGSARFELAALGRSLDEVSEGVAGELEGVESHLEGLDRAWERYMEAPPFPEEGAEAARTRRALDRASSAAAEVLAAAKAGDVTEAEVRYTERYVPLAVAGDVSLQTLWRINLDQGTAAGRRADEALARARSVTIVLDSACAVFTASLAALAVVLLRRALRAEVRRADELDAFAARVAHDLRGPLSAPAMALQRFAKSDIADPKQQRDFAGKGLRGLQRADSLISDLLLFARAAAKPEPGARSSLAEAVSGALADVEGEAAANNVNVELAQLPGRSVCCAPGVLSSIVENLVRNAIRHMPPGKEPRVVSIRGEAHVDSVRVEVADTGAGIPSELQKTIFEPYVRGSSTRPGLGLGLATVRRLVQSHGGKIGLHSQVGKGSTFWFELPAASP